MWNNKKQSKIRNPKSEILNLLIRRLSTVLFVLFIGCQTQQIIVSGTFTSPQKEYKVVLPKEGWSYQKQGIGEDLAMWKSAAGGDEKQVCRNGISSFAIISRRQEYDKLPLDVLQTHLFIGIKDRRILSKQNVTLSEQRALHTVLIGEVNGSEIKISSYVVARKGWVYDLVYWAQPHCFDEALDDFERMVRSFVFIKSSDE